MQAKESKERVEYHDHAVARWTTTDLAEAFPVVTSLPAHTAECRHLILALIDCESTPGGEMIGKQFFVGEFIVHPVPLEQEDGEVKICRRLVLPQPSGPPISFVSEGVIKSLAGLAYAEGTSPPWEPPLKVTLRQRALKGGRRWFSLVKAKD